MIFQGVRISCPPPPSGSAHGFQFTTLTLESKIRPWIQRSMSIYNVLTCCLTARNLKPPFIFERVFIFCAKVPMVCRSQRRCPITDVTLESKVKVKYIEKKSFWQLIFGTMISYGFEMLTKCSEHQYGLRIKV